MPVEIPTHWVNLLADLPGEPLPPLSPRTGEPAGPDDLTPIFPMGADRAGGLGRARDRDPRRRCARPTGCGARRRCTARGAWSRRSARRRRSTTSTRASRPPARTSPTPPSPQAYENAQAGIRKLVDRDRRRAVGLVARVRVLAVRPGVRGLHGRLVLRPEALPALDDADLGRDRAPLAAATLTESGRAQRAAPDRLARDRDLRGGRGRRAARGHQLRARLGAQPRAAAPDGDRAGGDRADGARGRASRTWSIGCVGGGSNFAGLAFPFLREKLRGEREIALRRRRARRLPDADARRLRATTSATPPG